MPISLAPWHRSCGNVARHDAAEALYEKALTALEGEMARLGGEDEDRSGFRASHGRYYREYVDLLLQRNSVERAFEVLERSRARTLIETLARGRVQVAKGIDAELLDQERSLEHALSAKTAYRIELLSGRHTDRQVADANSQIDALVLQYRHVEEQIRATSPTWYALQRPAIVSLRDVQQHLLDDRTVLLEYALGEERSYVFSIDSHSAAAYALARRSEIEDAARRVYELVTVHDGTGSHAVTTRRNEQRAYMAASTALSRMILGPVADRIKGKRVLVVADGALLYIPFAALPVPAASSQPANVWVPLIGEHEIIGLPSASALAALRQQAAGRKPQAKEVAILADPVFDRNDERVASTLNGGASVERVSQAREPAEHLARSVADVNGGATLTFPRLPFTRREAANILAVTPSTGKMAALDFAASRSAATNSDLSQYRIVHFATHGLLDSVRPELSGLVFSLFDQNGRPQNGFLSLEDIYNLNLPADLIVLSGCKTALGKDIQGEGIIGLTRGFMYAGASRVVASLWEVDDFATAELMRRFYSGMERQGIAPAAALRAAQIQMWKQNRWSAPFYWAAFQIQGEWR